ncbi:MAG: DUF4402 domain-containing protein [Proteobacteria bacterium]|nr:DUF4402 domain-containing protein [Pseudomonadota bacterium]MBU1387404.1 DUF4402 domain-containing protein [Pseudomonadota bacterium]MBU1541689.1 DUF4402 domain-containing protein [Pseudomonadota bacterium]MBU2482008.1 DUF4402 domain-containing protein [Pseudomonadota bacterium]
MCVSLLNYRRLFAGLVIVLLCGNSLFSASISFIQPISFGNIIASPFGEIIEINAKTGPATPTVFSAGNSYVNGGFSGIIRVYSDIPGQMISLIYPVSIVLQASGANNMTLDGIDARSKIFATSTAVGEIDFDVGGLLHINSGQVSQNYTATMTVTVNIINP